MLAGVAATGEEEVFSIISAGIFLIGNIPQNHSKLRSTGAGGRTMNIVSSRYSRVPSPKTNKQKILRCVYQVRIRQSDAQRQRLFQERMQSLSVGLSACGLYLYLALHANGSCETSQTFFPTVTFHQSGRETRGPREDGSWSAPSHWLFGRWSWRPMARGPGSGHSRGNCL